MTKQPKKQPLHERMPEWASRGFDAGNYANAYTTQDLARALGAPKSASERRSEYRAAFVLGFLATYERSEMSETEREAHDAAAATPAGLYCVEQGMCDAPSDESGEWSFVIGEGWSE